MAKVAKLVLIDPKGHLLMLERSNHPRFGNDPDLPGGTLEDGESLRETMVREVFEEIGAVVDGDAAKHLYGGTDYSAHGVHYALYALEVPKRPNVTLSWEHAGYEWLPKDEFVAKAAAANDTFMRMVHDYMKQLDVNQSNTGE